MGLELVPNKEGYYEFIRNLRNDDRVRDGFIQQEHISLEEQVAYMQVHESDYFICLNDETPVGYIGVIDGDIRLCTSPDHQGQGIGTFMLTEIVKIFPYATGRIKRENVASIQAFLKAKVSFSLM